MQLKLYQGFCYSLHIEQGRGERFLVPLYDELGNVETITDTLGFTTTYTYDKCSITGEQVNKRKK